MKFSIFSFIVLFNTTSIFSQSIITAAKGGGNWKGMQGEGGDALNTQVALPSFVAVSATGDIYVADRIYHTIRKISTAGLITTVAGNGKKGFSGDGGQALNAMLYSPAGIALDNAGNLYIADQSNNRIRKVSVSGIISTIAGSGFFSSGFAGDGGLATEAKLNAPSGIKIDAAGNLYIADQGNNRIRKVSVSGIISTIAGTGISGFSGDGGPAIAAKLNSPSGLCIDGSGNLFVADQNNHRIRKINNAGVISTIAGTGIIDFTGDGSFATAATFSFPSDIDVDVSGNLYIVDHRNSRIRKIAVNGIITTIGGSSTYGFSGDGGLATQAKLRFPYGISVSNSGEIYIADLHNHRVRKITTNNLIATIAGNGTISLNDDGEIATATQSIGPKGLAFDLVGNFYFSDISNNAIRKVNKVGIISTVAGIGDYGYSGDGFMANTAQLSWPMGMAIDKFSNVYIAEPDLHRVRRIRLKK